MSEPLPRYTQVPLPPYSYVPGHSPHPISNAAGHMWGQTHQSAQPLDPAAWQQSQEYRFGVDLFNHGYYWESHEAWESLWHAAGRRGTLADFLKGLIKLAAAGVKAREGNPSGVRRHAARAIELLRSQPSTEFCAMNIGRLIDFAAALITDAEQYDHPQPELRLPLVIELADGS